MELDAFTRSYLETALWSTTDDFCTPLDANFGIEDFDPRGLAAAIRDCQHFQKENGHMLNARNARQAGHDFWLTRNGHGAGFWDGDWPEHGVELTKACDAYGEVNLYAGDDGKLYIAGEEG